MALHLFIQDANSIVSIVCGTDKIAWAHVDRGMMVLDWQQFMCPNFLKGPYMASAYLNDVSTYTVILLYYHVVVDFILNSCPTKQYVISLLCYQVSSVVALLPPADFYLIEKPSISVQNTTLFPVMAHMRTVEAMLFALLEPKMSPPESNVPPRSEN